jgi:hypothetical protein
MLDPEIEKEIMMYLPAVVVWIEKGQDITEADVRTLREVVPDHFKVGMSMSLEEIIKLNEKYLCDPTWKDYCKVMVSDKGKEWLKRNLNLLRKLSNA